MRWIVAVLIVAALVAAWVAYSELHRGHAYTCPAGTVRVHRTCIPT